MENDLGFTRSVIPAKAGIRIKTFLIKEVDIKDPRLALRALEDDKPPKKILQNNTLLFLKKV
jgi:hypothetical protein